MIINHDTCDIEDVPLVRLSSEEAKRLHPIILEILQVYSEEDYKRAKQCLEQGGTIRVCHIEDIDVCKLARRIYERDMQPHKANYR
jgi:beta-galactosidase GanA